MVALALVDLVDVDAAGQQVTLALGNHRRLKLGGVDVVGLNVLVDASEQCRHQCLDGLVHLARVGAEFTGDVCHRDLVEEVVETSHVEVPLS